MAFRWWADDDPIFNIECWLGRFVIFQEIWTSIVKKPYRFGIFKVGEVSGPPVPLWNRACALSCLERVYLVGVFNEP